jgi:hypothetical protein
MPIAAVSQSPIAIFPSRIAQNCPDRRGIGAFDKPLHIVAIVKGCGLLAWLGVDGKTDHGPGKQLAE